MPLAPHTRLGRYEVRSLLGAGGMGEVYLAQDTKLGRPVALKLLPAGVASDRGRMQRFIQEAQAASALNHPNIITIYEIEEAGGAHFIAAEFIEGETLRQRLARAHLTISEALDIAGQVAAALAAAHQAGIVHRDVKPDNIMLRRDGFVKVLDFGLAKLTEARPPALDPDAPTQALVKTETGTVLGTTGYMSPEQARGQAVDARTDVWSLGVVLYELVTRRAPFEGGTAAEVISLILQKEPPPLMRYAPDAPAELERIVAKALTKDRDERYQTIKDLLIDLRRLRRRLEVEAELARTAAPDARTGESAAPTASSAEYLVGEVKRHKLLAVAALLVVTAAALGLGYYLRARNSGAGIDSIAVLPLVNAGGDPNTEYLSDGISESLINSLTELRQLRVVARSTAFHYKGRDVDPQAVGRELGVRAVLTGRVRQLGDALAVQVDLVDARTGAQLWGEEYERKASDLLAVKQSIAREVTEKLRLRLSGEDQQRLARRETTNAEAYRFYLRGRYYWNKRRAGDIRKAIEQFQQAIDRDPNYALGYAGLADCYPLLEVWADVPSSETLPKARAAADRALQLDDSLAEAHTSSAVIYQHTWRWAEAEEEFRRAISLNPNYPTAHLWFSNYFRIKRQFDDSMREVKRAEELDPLSLTISRQVAHGYLLKNELNSAVEQCKRVIELDPGFPPVHETLGFAYLKQQRYEEAVAEFQRQVELSGRAGDSLGDLGYCYAVTGRRAEALRVLKELEERYNKRAANGQDVAAVYAGLGEKDQAFAWLEKSFEQRDGLLPFITYNFRFEDLRGDPRFADLVRRMGLQP